MIIINIYIYTIDQVNMNIYIYIYLCYEWKETHGHEPQTNWQLFVFFASKARGRSGIWRTRWRVLRSCNLQGSPTLRRRRSLDRELVNSHFFWRFLTTKKKIIKKNKAMKHGSFWCHLFLKPLGLGYWERLWDGIRRTTNLQPSVSREVHERLTNKYCWVVSQISFLNIPYNVGPPSYKIVYKPH